MRTTNILLVFFVFSFVLASIIAKKEASGKERDNHGCLSSAGYGWCNALGKCVRAWEVPQLAELHKTGKLTTKQFEDFCSGESAEEDIEDEEETGEENDGETEEENRPEEETAEVGSEEVTSIDSADYSFDDSHEDYFDEDNIQEESEEDN